MFKATVPRHAGVPIYTIAFLLLSIHALCVGENWFGRKYGPDAIDLSKVTSLIFEKNKMTTGRRTKPVEQLRCVGGSAGCDWGVYTARCENIGVNTRGDPNWKCEASLPENVHFGHIEVNCEGYNDPNDPFVLDGSCALEYTLEGSRGSSQYGGRSSTPAQSFSDIFFWILICIIFYGIVKSVQEQNNANRQPGAGHPPGNPPGGPGFGPGGPGFGPGFGPGYGPGLNANIPSTSARSDFWTGAVLGGLTGFFFGRPTYGYARPGYGGVGGGGGTRFGGGGGGTRFGGGGGFRSSSGFGGTSRR